MFGTAESFFCYRLFRFCHIHYLPLSALPFRVLGTIIRSFEHVLHSMATGKISKKIKQSEIGSSPPLTAETDAELTQTEEKKPEAQAAQETRYPIRRGDCIFARKVALSFSILDTQPVINTIAKVLISSASCALLIYTGSRTFFCFDMHHFYHE